MSLRIIVLGPYTGSILEVAGNIRRGMELATRAALAGFFVWPCWADWDMATRADLPMEWFKANTIAWLKCAEAILLAPGWENSVGVKDELLIAYDLEIPVFDSLDALIQWRDKDKILGDGWTEDDVEWFSGFPIIAGDLQRIEPVPLTEEEKQAVDNVIALFDGNRDLDK
jgi:hypothetical protein